MKLIILLRNFNNLFLQTNMGKRFRQQKFKKAQFTFGTLL